MVEKQCTLHLNGNWNSGTSSRDIRRRVALCTVVGVARKKLEGLYDFSELHWICVVFS